MPKTDRDGEVFATLRAAVPTARRATEIPPHAKQFELLVKSKIRPDVLTLLQATARRVDIWRKQSLLSLWEPGEVGANVLSQGSCRRLLAGDIHHFTQTSARLMVRSVLAALQYEAMSEVALGEVAARVNDILFTSLGLSLGEWLDDEMDPGLLVVGGYASTAYRKQQRPEKERTSRILKNSADKLGEWARLSEGGFIAAPFRSFGVDLGRALRHDIPEIPEETSPFSPDEFVLIGEGEDDELLAFAPHAVLDLIENGPQVVRGESAVRVNCPAHAISMGKNHMVAEMAHWMSDILSAYWDVIR